MDSPIGIELYDSEGKLVNVNKACLDMFGVSDVSEVKGFELFKDPNIPEAKMGKLKRGETIRYVGTFNFEKVKKLNLYETTKSGIVNLDVLITPLYQEDIKSISNYLVQVQDITERKLAEKKLRESEEQLRKLNEELIYKVEERTKKLRESEEKYRLISENAKDLIIVLDDKFIVEYVNEGALLNMLGYSRDFFIGKIGSQFLHPDDLNNVLELFNKRLKLVEGSIEVRLLHKDGHYIWVETIGKIFVDRDKKSKVIIISRDITERKIAEQKLKESEEKYRGAYKIANFYKDLFAHDMNNILSNILASSNLCILYLNKPESQSKLKELLNIISDQVKAGSSLISNVRKLSKLEKSEIPTQSTEACKFLKRSILSVKNAFRGRKINVQVDSFDKKIFVQANNLIEDVFGNILNNAVKYNDNISVEILVKISKQHKKGKNCIKFEFMDNGIGVADDQKDIIFKRGYKKKKSARGMGIGLSLVKKIIESYKGQIWVEDKIKGDPSKGSNFIILIPEAE